MCTISQFCFPANWGTANSEKVSFMAENEKKNYHQNCSLFECLFQFLKIVYNVVNIVISICNSGRSDVDY